MISPCVNICQLDESGCRCKGCGRTIQQIAEWGSYSEKKRKQITKQLSKQIDERDSEDTNEKD